jgi:hypothetical protein
MRFKGDAGYMRAGIMTRKDVKVMVEYFRTQSGLTITGSMTDGGIRVKDKDGLLVFGALKSSGGPFITRTLESLIAK